MASVGHWQHSLQLSSKQTSQPVTVVGEIDSLIAPLPLNKLQNVRFNIRVTHLDNKRLYFTKHFRLSWREPLWQLQQGQRVKLLVKVKPPHGLANEAGFNYQQWLFSEGITATGYVKTSAENHLLNVNISARQSLFNQFMQYELQHQSWVAALTFGFRGLLQPEDWQLVQKTGVAHLIAISGLHLALVASLSYVLIAWLGGFLVSRFNLLHRINLHNVAMLLTLVSTYIYSGLAGFGLPTLRAWFMLALFSTFFLIHRQMGTKRLILLGLASFILIFPTSIFALSFWLSFVAVCIICFIFWRWPMQKEGFALTTLLFGMVKLQLSLTVLMLPLIAWQFAYISVVSPLANLVAVPFVTFCLVPICLLAVIVMLFNESWAEVLFLVADRFLDHAVNFLHAVITPNWAHFDLPAIPTLAWLCVFLFILGCCLPTFWLDKKYFGLLLLPLLSYGLLSRTTDWQIDVLDVGQGAAVIVSKNNRAIIYDVGAQYPSGFNMADSVILPLLRARGISTVDKVFISHGDNDHAGSLAQLLEGIAVDAVFTNQDSCVKGMNVDWQGLNISAIWPDSVERYNANNGSCVLKISDQYHSVLLPGDIDKSIESRLVEYYPKDLSANILLAPHHGSNTSSSSIFIQAVRPEFVVFSQAFMNRWQFPRVEVVNRYQSIERPARLFSTSDVGQVTFRIRYNSVEPIKVKTHRQDIYPFWYANI